MNRSNEIGRQRVGEVLCRLGWGWNWKGEIFFGCTVSSKLSCRSSGWVPSLPFGDGLPVERVNSFPANKSERSPRQIWRYEDFQETRPWALIVVGLELGCVE